MRKVIEIRNAGDIGKASEYVRECVDGYKKDHIPADLCVLICEELLNRLKKLDMKDVSLSCGRRGSVEICASGPHMSGLEGVLTENSDEEIEDEISRNILLRYYDLIYCHYSAGVNRFSIHFDGRSDPDISEEIYSYYENEDSSAAERPEGILRYLAGRHKLLVSWALINKSVKHLFALALPVFASDIIDLISAEGKADVGRIILLFAASAVALTLNLICAWLDNRVYHRFVRRVENGFKLALVKKLQMLSMKYHNNAQDGRLLSKLASDVQFIKFFMYENLQDVLHMSIDIVFVAIVSLLKMPVMLIFYAAAVPAASGLIRAFRKPIGESKVNLRKRMEDSNASFKEMLTMEKVTRAHGLEREEYKRIFSKVSDVMQAAVVFDRYQLRLNSIGYGSAQGLKLVCLALAAFLTVRGQITIGAVVLFISLFDTVINSVQKVLDQMPQLVQGYDSLRSVNEILFEKDVEKNGTRKLPQPVKGGIEVRDLVFSYDEGDRPVFNGLSFSVPAGKSVAFVGRSGIGKTTLLSLILGIYSKDSGQILIDGVDIDELDKNNYRSYVAVVPQNTVLFSGTLLDNLVYGLNYVTTERVMEVLKSVGLSDLYEDHPEGLRRPVYEGGDNLSGGQKQRISIARALLREPRIILFDEATSALDAENERKVQEAIEAIMGTCTVLLVAHRTETLRRADIIYRIKGNGEVEEVPFDLIRENELRQG